MSSDRRNSTQQGGREKTLLGKCSITFDPRNGVLNRRPFLEEERKTSARAEYFSVWHFSDMALSN
jgi:hypothetical protein